MRKKYIISSFFLIIALLYGVFEFTSAAVSSCSASVSPGSVVRNTTNNFTFTINNTDSVTYNWIKITRPSPSVWTLNSGSATGWSASANSDNVTFTGGSLAASGSLSITVNATAADFTSDSTAWTVQTSDNGGSSTFNCTGSLGTSITNPPSNQDTTPPLIPEISVSDVTSSSVKISWTTDESATSAVEYGTTDDYGSTESDSTLATSHSITLNGLTANTTYHYSVRSVDAFGNTTQTGDNTFVAAKASSTATTSTTTSTSTSSSTAAPTPIPDKTVPSIRISTDFSVPYSEPPTITGTAYDASGVNRIEYSTDGVNWAPVSFKGVGAVSISFSFVPEGLDEDNYELRIRAFDTKSNVGYSKTLDLVIDRLPPQIGGAMFYIGPQVIFPEENGALNILQGIEHSIVFSAVGGPIKMELLSSDKKFKVSKDKQSGLWTGKIKFEKTGEFSLVVKAVDGAGKKAEKKIVDINVLDPGKVLDKETNEALEGAKITVYYLNPKSKNWITWDGEQYSQSNPAVSNKRGEFSLYLPGGNYYITASKGGYINSTSDFFTLEKPTAINYEISLTAKQKIEIGPFSLYLPDFFFKDNYFPLQLKSTTSGQNKNPLIDKEAPDFVLKTVSGKGFRLIDKRGTPVVLTFITSWSPSSLDQILAENKMKSPNGQIYVVDIQEPLSRISVFQKRGGYSLDFISDPDGTLVEPYTVNFLPTHYFLDRKGIVRKVISGVLNREELDNYLEDVALY